MHEHAQRLLMNAYGPNLTPADAAAAISLVRSRVNVMTDVVSESCFLFAEPVLKLPLTAQDADILRQFAAALQTEPKLAIQTEPKLESADKQTAANEAAALLHEVQQQQHQVHACPAAAAATALAIAAIRAATKLKPSQLFPPIRLALTVHVTLSHL